VSDLDYVGAALLGVIQGLTEFLPISSSAHLALTQRWLGLDPDSTRMLLFDVVTHCGTLVAVFIVFAAPARRFLRRLPSELSPAWPQRRYALQICGLAAAASVPTAVIGLALKDTFESAFDKPRWIGAALIVTGLLLACTKWTGRATCGWREFGWWRAALVGFAQAGAILPGISRSGATICIARFLGLRKRWAAQFSFLIAVPAILGAAAIKFKDAFERPVNQLDHTIWGPIILGGLISAVVGVGALRLLLNMVQRAKLYYFAPYCWLLGVLLVAGVLERNDCAGVVALAALF